jgi:hypothetical protein
MFSFGLSTAIAVEEAAPFFPLLFHGNVNALYSLDVALAVLFLGNAAAFFSTDTADAALFCELY